MPRGATPAPGANRARKYRGRPAASGEEETAPWLCLQERELHISADAAYMVKQYDELSGDASVLLDYGAQIVFETARFFASRVTWNAEAKRYELRDIGCPDQYHTFADNDVFISRMAQWNLAYAAELAGDARLRPVRGEDRPERRRRPRSSAPSPTVSTALRRMRRALSRSSTASSRSPPTCAASARAIARTPRR